MLLTELILSKRGPLAKVWLSAHHERKLSKQQALGVDVGESIDAILTRETEPIALRLSGQLMLGVVRIYSRKVQYLFDDCKETRERISLAFRPGIVDLPEDQIRANKNAITFSDNRNDFDILDWSFSVPGADFAPLGLHTAPAADINLRPSNDYGAYNFGRPKAPSIYGGSVSSRHPSQDLDDTSHLDSQDFEGLDLGLDLENFGTGHDDMSLEYARDAAHERSRTASVMPGAKGVRGDSVLGTEMGPGGVEGIDLGLDFSGDFGMDLPQLEDDRARRDSSALSTPPPLSPPADAASIVDITPRTAARIGQLADARDTAAQRAAAAVNAGSTQKPKRLRLVQADEELELADEDFLAPGEDSDLLLGGEQYLPANPEIIRLREMISDPTAHFLPSIKVGERSMIYAGPEGLIPELAELFSFDTNILRRNRGTQDETEDERAAKRQRVDGGETHDEDDVEMARRHSVVPSLGGFDHFGVGDDSFDLGLGDMGEGPDYTQQLNPDDLPGLSTSTPRKNTHREREETREPSLAPSRAESIARAIQFGDEEFGSSSNILAMFDGRTRKENGEPESQGFGQSQSQSLQDTPSKSVYSVEVRASGTGKGYSKNTGMAMGLLRRELEVIEAEDEMRESKVLSFGKVADKASKRAASTFFFELLVLGTRDCVKLEQKFPFEDIEIRGKSKLWEEITA